MTADYRGPATGVPEQGPTAAAPAQAARSGSNLGTVVLALGALAIVGGIIAALVLFVFAPKSNDIEVRTPQTPAASGSTTASPTPAPQVAAGSSVRVVTNDQVFTFRDVFEPLLKPIKKPATGGTTGDTTGGTTGGGTTTPVDTNDYSAGTLYLLDIVTEDGVMKAKMVWNQTEITLTEGQSISGTPWKVLDITANSVIMLYGDQQVPLTVGQGISK